jgi:copper homeostasis protein
MLLEVACFNVKSALIAAEAGADRIEFCADYASGGITPTLEDFVEIRKKIKVPIYIMIHPKAGPYTYNQRLFDMIKNSISTFKKAKADGFVFASMYSRDGINVVQNKELVKEAAPLPCTFHRAFDEISNKSDAMESILKCGFQRVLTSGNSGKAIDHIDLLVSLQKKYGSQVTIMPGGGIRSNNVQAFIEAGIFPEIHSAGIIDGEIADKNEIKDLLAKIK